MNNLQGEVMNILKNMCEMEICTEPSSKELKVQSKTDVDMDVDQENLKASRNVSSLREVTWDEQSRSDQRKSELLLFYADK